MKKMNTQSVDFLNENWDCNNVFQFDLDDRMGILYVLTNADEDVAEKVSEMWYNSMENDAEPVSVEACFKKLGYLAVCALHMNTKKIY